VFRETRQHAWTDFLVVVEGENDIRPAGSRQHLVGSSLALEGSTDAQQRRQHAASA